MDQCVDGIYVCLGQMEFTIGHEMRDEHEYFDAVQQTLYIVALRRRISLEIISYEKDTDGDLQELGSELVKWKTDASLRGQYRELMKKKDPYRP